MPTLPLTQGFSIIPQGGDLPVTTSADVVGALPATLRPANQATPVRDALCEALAGAAIRHQEFAAYAAAQCDLLRATDQYLVGLADDHGFYQQPNESDEAFRERLLAVPELVTPNAIVGLANTLLAPYIAIQARYLESALDRWFVSDATGFHSFVGASPQYLDRLYRDDAPLNGASIDNRDPGGAWVFGDESGRSFILRVPVVNDSDVSINYAGFNAAGNPIKLAAGDTATPELGGAELQTTPLQANSDLPATAGGRGLFVADGSNTGGSEADGTCATFMYAGGTTALSLYQGIVNSIERIRGQGIRWQLYVDPLLTA